MVLLSWDDEIGKLIEDFHQTDPQKMHYCELAKGVEHFKETERGRDQMCEAVEQFAKEYADEEIMKSQINNVQHLMDNVNFTLEQALDALKIQGHEREVIIEHFKK